MADCGVLLSFTDDQLDSWLDVSRASRCAGYVQGVYDVARWVLGPGGIGGDRTLMCPPNGVWVPELVPIVYEALQENPDRLHLSAGYLVFDALAEAFPCDENQPDE